jgi:hypothetical protein
VRLVDKVWLDCWKYFFSDLRQENRAVEEMCEEPKGELVSVAGKASMC